MTTPRHDLFDPTLVAQMLGLTPVERIRRHDHALEMVRELQRARRIPDVPDARPSPTTDSRPR